MAKYPWCIKTNCDQSFPKPANGNDFSLEEVQALVGGQFEVIKIPKDREPRQKLIMLVNEKGRLLGLPVNMLASQIAGQEIVGNALVCPTKMFK